MEEYRAIGWERYRGVDVDTPEHIFGLLLAMAGLISAFFTWRVFKSFQGHEWGPGKLNGAALALLSAITLGTGLIIFARDGAFSMSESQFLWSALCLAMVILSLRAHRFNKTRPLLPKKSEHLSHEDSPQLQKKLETRNLGKRYTALVGIGAAAFVLSIFTYPISGGMSGVSSDLNLYFNAKAANAVLADTYKEHTYNQTGTGVEFTKYDVGYSFVLNGQRYVGQATIDQSPAFMREIVIYYDPSNPNIHTPHMVGGGKITLIALLWLPIPLAMIFLIWGGMTYRKFKTMSER